MVDYGWGTEVNDGGSWLFTSDGKSRIVDDRDNFGQQVKLRLLSPRGSHPFDPEYGLDVIGMHRYKKFYKSIIDAVKQSVINCLTKKRTVKNIDMFVMDNLGNRTWELSFTIITHDGVEHRFNTLIDQNGSIRDLIDNVIG